MKFVLKTAPTKYPIELNDVKRHLNITPGWTEDDEYLQDLIKAVTDDAEQITRRRFITQTWYYYLDKWPNEDYITLPFGQLQSITAIKYTDVDATQSTWSTAYYNTDTDSDPGRATVEYGYTYPTVSLHPQNPIEIEFVCGYGVDPGEMPPRLHHAMRLLIADLYEQREESLLGQGFTILNTEKAHGMLRRLKLFGY